MTVTTAHRNEQAAYYRLCDEARALGIQTSLDDPGSIARDSEILAKRIAAVQRLAFLRKLLASPYERAA